MYILIPKEYITPELAEKLDVVTVGNDHNKLIETVIIRDASGQIQEVASKWITFKACEKTIWRDQDEQELINIINSWNLRFQNDSTMQLSIENVKGTAEQISTYLGEWIDTQVPILVTNRQNTLLPPISISSRNGFQRKVLVNTIVIISEIELKMPLTIKHYNNQEYVAGQDVTIVAIVNDAIKIEVAPGVEMGEYEYYLSAIESGANFFTLIEQGILNMDATGKFN